MVTHNEKTEKIIEDSKRKDIPIFVITAKDKLAIETIHFYRLLCLREKCNKTHTMGVKARLEDFNKFARENPELIKIPD